MGELDDALDVIGADADCFSLGDGAFERGVLE